jgi:hypothetical protein
MRNIAHTVPQNLLTVTKYKKNATGANCFNLENASAPSGNSRKQGSQNPTRNRVTSSWAKTEES